MSKRASLSVVHALAPARFGGLETVVAALADEQTRQGVDVCVAPVLSPGEEHDHPLLAALDRSGVIVEPIVVAGREYRHERARIREVLQRRGADVLHTHGYRPDVLDAPVARTLGIPIVSTVHGYTGGGFRNRMYEWLQTRAMRRFDAVIAVSGRLAVDLEARGVRRDRIHVLRNAWRPAAPPAEREAARRALGLPADGPIVGWVGRLSEEKGPDVMIRAFEALGRPDVRLSVVGSGPMEAGCREMAAGRGLAQQIDWHGSVDGAGLLLRAFDVLALTSWTEGTPMVVLEAMSSGVPLVVTAVGGVPDVVSDAEARLCTAGEPGEIAEAIANTLDDGAGAQDRVEAARRRLERDFDVGEWARRHRDIYKSAASVR